MRNKRPEMPEIKIEMPEIKMYWILVENFPIFSSESGQRSCEEIQARADLDLSNQIGSIECSHRTSEVQ